MTKTSIRAVVLAGMIVATAVCHAKPNVIFVLTDDLGYGDVGWAWQEKRRVGEARIFTPNLDRLVREAVIEDSECGKNVVYTLKSAE